MRALLWTALAATMLAGCASTPEYFDNHAAVDANPACASRPDHPNQPVSRDCERSSGMRWGSGSKATIDLSGGKSKP